MASKPPPGSKPKPIAGARTGLGASPERTIPVKRPRPGGLGQIIRGLAVVLGLGLASTGAFAQPVTKLCLPGTSTTGGAPPCWDVGTANPLPVTPGTGAQIQIIPGTSGGLLGSSVIVPNNTTSVALKASAGQLYGIEAFSISAATPIYIKYYNTAQGSVTCGSGTPVWRQMVPATGATGSGFVIDHPNGRAFSTAITYCITAGILDSDTTAPAANSYIVNFLYK